MLKSVEEVAIELGISKTAIYNKLKLKKYKDMVVKKHGKSMIEDELLKLIKDSIKVKKEKENHKNKNSENTEKTINTDGLINFNKEFNMLSEQLKKKDKQIEELQKLLNQHQKLLENNQKLLENNQVLLKQQQDKEINQLNHFKKVDAKILSLKEKMEERKQTEKRKTFFNFFNNRD